MILRPQPSQWQPNPGVVTFAKQALATREVQVGLALGGAFLGGMATAALVAYFREASLGLSPVEVVDVQAKAANAKYKKTGNLKRRSFREWDDLEGITLHQVGVREVGRGAYPGMTAHLGVHHDGTIYWIHPLTTRLAASDALNPDTVAIEVAGLFGSKTPLPAAQANGLRWAIRLIQQQVAENGGNIRYIYGHRQGAADRPFGPQRAIWQGGALWAEEKLGILTRPHYSRGSGRTIPPEWDPRLAQAA